MTNEKVVVVGLGEIGKPFFDILAEKYPGHVLGIDIAPQEINSPVSFMHVCYPFELPGGFIETTLAYAQKYKPQCIVVHSTVLPGTTRTISEKAKRATVYSPIRGKHTRMRQDLLHYTKFVAGTDSAITQTALEHLRAAGFNSESVEKPEALELGKLFETTYFGLLIAWAQDMNRMAEKLDCRYEDVTKLFKEVDYLPRNLFLPGFIGGHCVIPNIQILKKRFDSEILDAILDSNTQRSKELGSATSTNRLTPQKL